MPASALALGLAALPVHYVRRVTLPARHLRPAQERPNENPLPAAAQQAAQQVERGGNRVPIPLGRHLRLTQLIHAVVRDAGPHHLDAFAGNLAYNAFVAIIPFMLFVLLVMRALHLDDLLGGVVSLFAATLPASSSQLLQDQIQSDVTSRVPAWWVLGLLLAAGSLWACSAAFRAVSAALNVMYGASDHRPVWIRLGLSILLALATAILWLIAFVAIEMTSRAVGAVFQAPRPLVWNALRLLVMLLGAFVAAGVVYAVVPSDRRPLPAIVPGAACAAVGWLVFSLGFDFVLNEFGQLLVDPLYGWFTGLFALLLYLYWSSYLLLLGAEVNHAIEVQGRDRAQSDGAPSTQP